MLGLDASMMEDDVLNDMYIDGYTGSDIYRIMGSAGPGAGKPMGVKLPPKPFTFKQNNDFINVKMVPSLESSIAQERAYILQESAKNQSSETAKTLGGMKLKLDAIDELIKNNKYSEAMQTYLESDNLLYRSSFAASLQQFDEFYAGSVSRNPLLTDSFKTTYLTQIGDIKDDEAAAAVTTETAGTQAPIVTTEVKQPPKNATVTDTGVIKFETVADRDAAVEAGTIPLNSDVQVGDGPIVPFTPPSSYEPVDTSKPITFSTNIEDARALASELSDQGIEAYPVIKKDDDKDTVLVQIGVYETKEDAEAAYKKLKTTVNAAALASPFMAYPDDYEPIYEATESGGKKFVRLRLQVPNKKPTDLGDMTGAPGFRERDDISEPSDFIEKAASRKYGREGDIAGYKAMYDTVMALPEDDRSSYVEAFESIEDMPEVTEVIQEVTKDVPGFVDNVVGKGAGAVGMGGLLFYKGMAYADAFITGDKARVAEGLIKADKAMERAKEVFSEGIVQYLQEKADEAGMQGGFSKARGEKLKKALAKDTNVIAAIDSRLQDAGDVWRSGDVFASGGGQVEAESDPAVLSGVFDTKDGVPSRTDIDNLKTVLELNQVTLPEKVTKEDVAEEAKIDEIIVANLDTSQDITRQDFDKIKTILEQEQLIDTSTDELYRGPISGKTLVEKLDDIYNFYTQEDTEYNPRAIGTVGSRDLGLRDTTDDVRPPRNREPDAQTRTRATLGDTRTEPDATVPSITAVNRGDRPSGLMSPNKDTRKVNVGDLATFADPELMDNIKRLHGSGSKLFKDFDNKISSGTMKPADISRLIKATRKLPNTKSKDKLLNSLFDLRDALNKR
jgi:hypothetical protein